MSKNKSQWTIDEICDTACELAVALVVVVAITVLAVRFGLAF